MAKEGIKGMGNCKKHYIEICKIVDGDVSAEVLATDYAGMIKEGEELTASIRKTQNIMQYIETGADVATCPLSAIKGLFKPSIN